MSQAQRRPRVVLAEDDPSLRRFVELALEELPIDLVVCETVDAAWLALQERESQLLLTDLQLGSASGFDLIERLNAEQTLAGRPKVAVFSAGITTAVEQRLRSLGVWRILAKPAGLSELEQCVKEAVWPADPAPHAGEPSSSSRSPRPVDEAAAIAAHFNGDSALYESFRLGCLEQFARDAADGDRACSQRNLQALRRVAHNLKGVLQMLGVGDLAAAALAIEQAAEQADSAAALERWAAFQPRLLLLATPAR